MSSSSYPGCQRNFFSRSERTLSDSKSTVEDEKKFLWSHDPRASFPREETVQISRQTSFGRQVETASHGTIYKHSWKLRLQRWLFISTALIILEQFKRCCIDFMCVSLIYLMKFLFPQSETLLLNVFKTGRSHATLLVVTAVLRTGFSICPIRNSLESNVQSGN